MKIFRRWLSKRKLKKDIKEYHNGRRDQMEISDYEKQENANMYELKIQEQNAEYELRLQEKSIEIDKRDDEIKELKDTLLYCNKKLEKHNERMIGVDSALLLVEKCNEVEHTVDNNRYKAVLTVVGSARARIRRELEKLPKLQKKVSERVNKVL